MEFLTKEQILKVSDIDTQIITVKEWNGKVCVRGLNAAERGEMENILNNSSKIDFSNIRARVLSWTIIDPKTKEKLFTENDINELNKKSAAVLDKLFTEVQKLSKLTNEDIEGYKENFSSPKEENLISK